MFEGNCFNVCGGEVCADETTQRTWSLRRDDKVIPASPTMRKLETTPVWQVNKRSQQSSHFSDDLDLEQQIGPAPKTELRAGGPEEVIPPSHLSQRCWLPLIARQPRRPLNALLFQVHHQQRPNHLLLPRLFQLWRCRGEFVFRWQPARLALWGHLIMPRQQSRPLV